jgi:hypothetical protein
LDSDNTQTGITHTYFYSALTIIHNKKQQSENRPLADFHNPPITKKISELSDYNITLSNSQEAKKICAGSLHTSQVGPAIPH